MPQIRHVIESFARIEPMMAVFWLGLVLFTACLAVLMYTRWGQYRPLRKCMVLSLLAHLMLACYAATIHITTPMRLADEPIRVSIGDGPVENELGGGASRTANANGQPWEVFPDDAVSQPKPAEFEHSDAVPLVEPKRLVRAGDARLPGDPPLERLAMPESKSLTPISIAAHSAQALPPGKPAESIDAPAAQRRDAVASTIPNDAVPADRLAGDMPGRPVRVTSEDLPAALLDQFTPLPPMSDSEPIEPAGSPNRRTTIAIRTKPFERREGGGDGSLASGDSAAGGGQPNGPLAGRNGGQNGSGSPAVSLTGIPRGPGDPAPPVPDAYRLRVAPDRNNVAQSRGGTAETEAAVKAALKWLADNQDADGRWNPRTHGGGRETNVLGRDRQNAGSRADSAMTRLALLAFLAAGHTHLEGPYRDDVRRGLEYLMRTQAADGNLAGNAAPYEFMYCHAIAACAMSEAYGMTHDARLREPVSRAVTYTLRAQDPIGGGWRYRPGDAGDTSQLGWQVMVLKSAELAGVPIPDNTRQGIIRFLRSVSSGRYGGKASYRPAELTTRTMSAEAMVCWQFLGLPRQNPACDEAGDYLLGELPSAESSNLYYWYYATLAMYQLQGEHWQRWNDALREAVVRRQVKDGSQAGSWDTDDLWAGYGGRIYTTALATLTLEVYYRFLPLYADVAPNVARAK